MDSFLFQATIYLAASVIAVPIAKRIGLGSVLGYIIAGVVIGQIYRLLGVGASEFEGIAEVGIILLLFVIGLEIEPKELWRMRNKLVGLGGLQIGITALGLALLFRILGLGWEACLALGLAFSLSSTAMVLQTLTEKGLSQTEGGRNSLSVLLTQDVAFIPILVIIPLFATGTLSPIEVEAVSETTLIDSTVEFSEQEALEIPKAFIEQLPPWGSAGLTLVSIAVIIAFGYFVVRPFFHYITASGLSEISMAATLFVVVFASLLMKLVGFSPALGTFLAGVVLATSEFRHEMRSHVDPFKGLMLGLFFITVGSGINFFTLFSNFFVVSALTVGVIGVKLLILYGLTLVFKMAGRNQWLFVLGLAQAGEFSLVLLVFMLQTGVIDSSNKEILTLVVTMTMALTPALFVAFDYISRTRGKQNPNPEDDNFESGPVIIAGVGRFGETVNEFVSAFGHKTVILDNNFEVIKKLRFLGYKAFLGNPSRPELLDAAGLDHAIVLVVAIDKKNEINQTVSYARRKKPDLLIVARAIDRNHEFELHKIGANEIIREVFDSAVRAGQKVVEGLGIPRREANLRAGIFSRYSQYMTKELSLVWDPKVPNRENEAYIKKLKQLNNLIDVSIGTAVTNNSKSESLTEKEQQSLKEQITKDEKMQKDDQILKTETQKS